MKVVYLKNFRKGFATNSSSTHNVIYKNKDDLFKDLNIFERNFYDRYTETIAVTKEAKIKYIAANIMYNKKLLDIMCKLYPSMLQYIPLIDKIKEMDEKFSNKEISVDDYINFEESPEYFGMYARGSLYFNKSKYLEGTIDYLIKIIENNYSTVNLPPRFPAEK